MPDLSASDQQLARFLVERGLGIIYLVGFVVAAVQFPALLGERGLLPAPRFLGRVSFWRAPSLFHLRYSDRLLRVVAWSGPSLAATIVVGLAAAGAAAAHDAGLVRAVGAVPVDRQRRPDVLRLRLGDAPARGRLPGHLPRQRRSRAAVAGHPAVPLARVPGRVRSGAHQASRRCAAGARCAAWTGITRRNRCRTRSAGSSITCRGRSIALEVVGNFVAQLVLPFGLFLPQPLASIAALLMIADPAVPHRQRQLRLAQLADDRRRGRRDRRRRRPGRASWLPSG